MIVQNIPTGKLIILSKAFDNRAKILNIFYFLLFTALAARLTEMVLDANSITVPLAILLVVIISIYLFAGYKFINKALFSEVLIVNKNDLTIIKRGIATQKNNYDNALVSNFRHLEIKEPIKHALAGQSFDYLGFQTQQMAINQMHGDNRLAFDYDGRTVTFGENVYTWDFEELIMVLFNVTEKDFGVKETYEKSYKLENGESGDEAIQQY